MERFYHGDYPPAGKPLVPSFVTSCKIFLGMKSRIALIIVFGTALVATWPIHSKIAQARRNAVYQRAIAPFQRDLHLGMAKADVKHYLDSQHFEYFPVRIGGDERTYEIKIGEEDGLVCEWNVYIALEFSSNDALREVHIRKIGTCL